MVGLYLSDAIAFRVEMIPKYVAVRRREERKREETRGGEERRGEERREGRGERGEHGSGDDRKKR